MTDTLARAAGIDASGYAPLGPRAGVPVPLAGPPPKPLVPWGPQPFLAAKFSAGQLTPNVAQQQTRQAQVPFIDIPQTSSSVSAQSEITQNAQAAVVQATPSGTITVAQPPSGAALIVQTGHAATGNYPNPVVMLPNAPTPGNTLVFLCLYAQYGGGSVTLPGAFKIGRAHV